VWKETNAKIEAVPARAWFHAYGRTISDDERARSVAFLRDRMAKHENADPKPAIAELCLAIFNTNEFIYQQ
jgi:hypothetical protein